jgi:hypothetical protein
MAQLIENVAASAVPLSPLSNANGKPNALAPIDQGVEDVLQGMCLLRRQELGGKKVDLSRRLGSAIHRGPYGNC